MKNTHHLLKIKKIAGVFYKNVKKTDTIIIYGIGAPTIPDNGDFTNAPTIMNYGIDLFVPDYVGFARSEGIFTPRNCIKTFLQLFDSFKNGCLAKSSYEQLSLKLKYKRIIFIGRSLGGAYIPLLPKYNKQIKELAIFYPAVDQNSQGIIKGEETNKQFMDSMKNDGYYHLYRGILHKRWWNHLSNQDSLSPMENIKFLKNVKLFIAHGKLDTCIHFSKSVKYYQKIIKMFPDKKNSVKFKLYPKGDHGSSTSNLAIKDFLKWLKV